MPPHTCITLIMGMAVFGLQDQDMTCQLRGKVSERHIDQAVTCSRIMNGGLICVAAVQDDRATRFGQQDCRQQAHINVTGLVLTESRLKPRLFCGGDHASHAPNKSRLLLRYQYIM